ncbi:MAG: phospholipase D-like domain-containing protein [Snowella sp.]|nr:phospholipase D-like domain-containing protein [Snowella sp.]
MAYNISKNLFLITNFAKLPAKLEIGLLSLTVAALIGSALTQDYRYLAVPTVTNLSFCLQKSRENHAKNTSDQSNTDPQLQALEEANASLKKTLKSYSLIDSRLRSRRALIDALKQANRYVVLVCPWITDYALDQELRSLIESLLNKGICLYIGWGSLKDVNNDPQKLNRDCLLKSASSHYKGIFYLEKLQSQYPKQIFTTVLGTHENCWIVDGKIAFIGSFNFLKSGVNSTERELGVMTKDEDFIIHLLGLYYQSLGISLNKLSESQKVKIKLLV